MDLYHKPSDTTLFTLYIKSYKPLHTKYTILLGAKNLCHCHKQCPKIKKLEKPKFYHNSELLIKQGIQKAISFSQQDLQKPKEFPGENILVFIARLPPKKQMSLVLLYLQLIK